MLVEEKRMITKYEYMNLLVGNRDAVKDFVYDIAIRSSYHPNGYGLFNPNFKVINGDYYMTWERYPSCD